MAKLERAVRLQRGMVLLVGMLVAAPFVGAAGIGHQNVITCSGIVIDRTDSSGQVKILPNGIFIGNKNNNAAIVMQVKESENSVTLQDGTGSDIVGLYATPTDRFINASSATGSVEVHAGADGASLTVRDKDGNDRGKLAFDGSAAGKGGVLALLDAAGQVTWEPSSKKGSTTSKKN